MEIGNLLISEPLLADRTRMVIMTVVSASEAPVSFTFLLQSLNLTKGNLSSHVKKLEEEGYLSVKKEFVDKKPLTTYNVTKLGLEAVRKYLSELEAFISNANLGKQK